MDDRGRYHDLPIPSYEEATGSRIASPSTAHTGPQEISDDAERQGLLGDGSGGARSGQRHGEYQAPTVESARTSLDSDLELAEINGDGEHDPADESRLSRREIEEMDFLDTPSQSRSSLSKRLGALTFRLPSIRLMPQAWSSSMSRMWTERAGSISLPIVFRLIGLLIIGLSVYLLFAYTIIPNRMNMTQRYDPESVRARAQAEADSGRIAEYLRYITSFDHVAGTEGDLFLAKWLFDRWTTAQMDEVEMLDYWVYLNYPRPGGRRVAIVDGSESTWEAQLEEDSVSKDANQARQQTLNWHGSSRAGNVTGHLVYANGGSREDFRRLEEMGVKVNGSIALVRYYATQGDRALKVKAAEQAGAVGCLIYSDPGDDGSLQGLTIPGGRWRPEDSVQRGSVGIMSWVLGDYLTPGWSSSANAKRISKDNNPGLVNIPSLPLAWRDAEVLLTALKDHGHKVDDSWKGGVRDNLEWWTGDDKSPRVLLQNEQDENERQQIWNVRAKIEGTEAPSQRVIVGNHRDAWCFGAVDPGSGTAVMAEVVNIFASLRRLGWRPLRTIEFFSWDAEEYNMMGSTEYVEGNIDDLRKNAVGYLNVDVGVSGGDFRAAASPLYERMLKHVLDRVSDPKENVTLKELWEKNKSVVAGLGAGSDYVAFQDLAGTSSLDFGFSGPKYGYPYHSCYETFEWMERFADPGFEYHKMLAQVWALLILELADRPIIPFDLSGYADAVKTYVSQLEADTKDLDADVGKLHAAVDTLLINAAAFHTFEERWTAQVLSRGGFEINAVTVLRGKYNQKMIDFETNLLDLPGMFPGDDKEQHGVPGREQYKHVIFGPQVWSGYDEAYFPAVRDALGNGDKQEVQRHIDKAAKIIERAAVKLLEEVD